MLEKGVINLKFRVFSQNAIHMVILKHVGLTCKSKNLVCLTRCETVSQNHGIVAREACIVKGMTSGFAGSMGPGSLIRWLF